MYIKLFVVWFLSVAAFFILWAVLAKLVKRISEKKHSENKESSEEKPRE